MTGKRLRSDLVRRIVTTLLVAAVPTVFVLAIFAFCAIRELVLVNHKLGQIGQSIQATEDTQVMLCQGNAALHRYFFQGDRRERKRFERTLDAIRNKLDTCAAAACHLAPVQGTSTPRMITERVRPIFEEWGRLSLSAFDQTPLETGLARFQQLDDLEQHARITWRRLRIMRAAETSEASALYERAYSVSKQALELITGLALMVAIFGSTIAILLRWRSDDLERAVRERTAELKRKDEELVQSEKLALLGLLASGVAHELNNPLTSILMSTHLIMEELGEGSSVYRDLKRIDADTTRCKSILDDLRTFARHRPPEKVPCRVEAVVAEAVRLAQYELNLREILFEQEIPADFPQVLWDPERMAQVLTNLFINGAQAMARGGRLSVGAHRGNEALVLEVRDTGPGIPKQDRARILDPFFTSKPDGTGLGLFISYSIIRDHGGQLEVITTTQDEIAPDRETGTTMRIILPLSNTTP